MRKVTKLIPVAIALVAFASCNSEDSAFFGAQNAKMTMEVNVAEVGTDDDATRAIFTESNALYWQTNDALRAYDANVQKYNSYTYDKATDKFSTSESNVTPGDEKYILFPKAAATYAGWKDGSLVSLFKLAPEGTLTYSETQVSPTDATPAYVSNVPLFGKVTAYDDGALKASAVYLTGALKIVLENGSGNVKKICVKSLKADGTTANKEMPLWGLFDAQLDDANEFKKDVNESKLVPVDTEEGVYTYKDANATLEVTTTTLPKYKSVVFIPIVPGTYPKLVVSYFDNASTPVEHPIATLVDKKIEAHHFYANDDDGKTMKVTHMLSYTFSELDENTTEAISSALAGEIEDENDKYFSTANGTTEVTFTANTAKTPDAFTTSALSAVLNVIKLPALQNDLTINFSDDNIDLSEKELTIADAAGVVNTGKNVTIKFTGFKASSKKIILNTTANVTLTGSFANLPSFETDAVDAITVTKVGTLKLGDAVNKFVVSNVESKNQQVTVNSGNLEAVNVEAAHTAANNLRLVNKKLESAKANNTVTVSSANIASVTDDQATEVNIKAAVPNVTTNAATVNIAANVTTLTLAKGVSALNLTAGTIGAIAENSSAKFDAANTLTVTSSGLSAIKSVGTFTNAANISYTSSYTKVGDEALTAGDFTVGDDTKLYTAAQLANIDKVTSKPYTLMTNITSLQNWASKALSVNFDGNSKTISAIDAPLFSTLTGGAGITISGLTITGSITGENGTAGYGVLAQEVVSGTVNVKNVTVNGTVAGYYNCGGVIGKVTAGTVNLGANKTGNNAKPVVSNVTFTNKDVALGASGIDADAGSFGEFIGKVNGGTIVIGQDCSVGTTADNAFDKSALLFHNLRKVNAKYVVESYYKGSSNKVGHIAAGLITYEKKEFKATKLPVADFADEPAGLSKSGTAWTLNVYTINPLAAYDAETGEGDTYQYSPAQIATIKTNIGFVDGETLTINYISHNTWESAVY